jgi:TfoX/Sxy family transcriptional regulator of competence genes
MEHDPKRLRDIMADAAPPELELAFRPMFGGIMAYAEGKPFASLSNVGLALKVKGPLFAEFLAAEGAQPLRYVPDAPPSKSYLLVPDEMLDDREALQSWMARAAAAL